MNSLMKAATMAAVALGLATPAAKANVVFDFVSTSVTYPSSGLYPGGAPTGFPVYGQLVVTDDAYNSGYTITRTQLGNTRTGEMTSALRGLSFVFGPEDADFNYHPTPMSSFELSYRYTLAITAAASSLPTGTITYGDTNFLFTFNLQGAVGSGLGGLSGTGACYSPGCAFTTTTAVTFVPEPASIALFGAGLLGLAGVMRRRGQTPAA